MMISVKPEFGYVIGVAVGSYFVHGIYMAAKVMSARKKYDVKYPGLYADKENCPDEGKRKAFNCVQRGHQNSLENQATFLSLLFAAGFKHPITAAGAGVAYLVGRILYMDGYSTGNPDGRYRGGALLYPGLLVLLGTSIKVAVDLVRGA